MQDHPPTLPFTSRRARNRPMTQLDRRDKRGSRTVSKQSGALPSEQLPEHATVSTHSTPRERHSCSIPPEDEGFPNRLRRRSNRGSRQGRRSCAGETPLVHPRDGCSMRPVSGPKAPRPIAARCPNEKENRRTAAVRGGSLAEPGPPSRVLHQGTQPWPELLITWRGCNSLSPLPGAPARQRRRRDEHAEGRAPRSNGG